jgi:hypothetical protein
VVRDRRRVASVVRLVNQLQLLQPGGSLSCPLDRGVRAHLTFRTRTNQIVARAAAALGGCPTLEITVNGASRSTLNGYGFFDNLQAALGKQFDLSRVEDPSLAPSPVPVVVLASGTAAGVPFTAVARKDPRTGLCVEMLLAGIDRGSACLARPRSKIPASFSAPACFPHAVTGVGLFGVHAAKTALFDDRVRVAMRRYQLPSRTVTTRVGLKGDQVVELRQPVKVDLGFRGPFRFGFRRGIHDLASPYGPYARC